MRTAQELIDAATATGTYTNYVGDGASVPWDLVQPPFQQILFVYKLYLDQRWPSAFQLHDWCYTPLGALIQVTREEADLALFEIIARDSLLDATIVYNAVRLGGGQYFGISATGLPNFGRLGVRQTGLTGRNIEPTGKDAFTMPTKCVILMKDATLLEGGAPSRIAGFSESVWHPSDDISAVTTALAPGVPPNSGLLGSRAALLPATGSIVGYKLYKGGTGKGVSARVVYPGIAGYPTDVPNLALQLNARSNTTGGVRRWNLHSIPDQFVVNGEFAPDPTYTFALNNYFQSLTQFGFYTKPTTETGFHITTIVAIPPVAPATTPSALVTTVEPHSFVVGDQATIFSTVLPNGQKLTVTMRVNSVPNANQFTFATWNNGNTTGGIAGSPLRTFDQFTVANISIGSVTTRKVGRPFDQFRGRRSKRRKTA